LRNPVIKKIKLVIKPSGIPRAGKGLFTNTFIPAGTNIVEYTGKIISWKEVKADNAYIFYVNRNHVIDAGTYKTALARYANDAKGIYRLKGKRNNAQYVEEGLSVFIQATRFIEKGEEIFVGYGKEYWDAIRHNLRLAKK
jgi:SET domain-containing protein